MSEAAGALPTSLYFLHMPRFDLTLDVALLNKMVILELLLKFLPQFLLQGHLTNVAGGWTWVATASYAASGVSLIASTWASFKTWRDATWASIFFDAEGLWNSAKKIQGLASTFISPAERPLEKVETAPVPAGQTVEGIPTETRKRLPFTPRDGNQGWGLMAAEVALKASRLKMRYRASGGRENSPCIGVAN